MLVHLQKKVSDKNLILPTLKKPYCKILTLNFLIYLRKAVVLQVLQLPVLNYIACQPISML